MFLLIGSSYLSAINFVTDSSPTTEMCSSRVELIGWNLFKRLFQFTANLLSMSALLHLFLYTL